MSCPPFCLIVLRKGLSLSLEIRWWLVRPSDPLVSMLHNAGVINGHGTCRTFHGDLNPGCRLVHKPS